MSTATVAPEWSAEEIRQIIRDRIIPRLPEWRECHSSAQLHAHPAYRELAEVVRMVLEAPETGHFSAGAPAGKAAYRFVAWNLERGIQLDGQIAVLRTHEYLSEGDVLLLTETDVGMARSGNRNVAREIARALGFHYVFIPSYFNLSKGAGEEHEIDGENELGLHGNAILSRYPLRNPRAIRLENGIDKMSGREKRIGCQAAVTAEVVFPDGEVTAVAIHLDAHSTQEHRREQMRTVIDALPPGGPVVLGGDWNTTTYNSATALHAILGFWRRVFMGVDKVIRNHYLHPDRRFERRLFALLESRGFDYRRANVPGEYTLYYDFANQRAFKGMAEWVPLWCFPFIRWALRRHDGRCPLKLDWFATRGVRVSRPAVLHDFSSAVRETPLSDHDPIAVDVTP